MPKISGLRLACAVVVATVISGPAAALKYASVQHHLPVDPSIASWHPGALQIEPEEEFNLVGADVMDEMTLGWVKLFRQAYPLLSMTMEARASGAGATTRPSAM